MKEKLEALWKKVVDNKELVIRVGLTVTGAVVGSVVTSMIANTRFEEFLADEMLSAEILHETENE